MSVSSDVLLHPVAEPGVGALPAGKPGGEVALRLLQVAPVVEPAQLLQAVVVGLAGHVVEGVPEEMDVAPLPGGLGQDLPEGLAQPGVVVGDHELDAGQDRDRASETRKSRQLVWLSRAASSTASTWRKPSVLMPMAMSTAWERITPPSRTFS